MGGVWDYAPAALIGREAGYSVTNLEGDEWDLSDSTTLIAHPAVHGKLLEILEKK